MLFDIVSDPSKITNALLIGMILTFAPTGSEMNAGDMVKSPDRCSPNGTLNKCIF
ncbi:hypothetical protein [Clostridium sp.]|uniref:hypothetical protein n=1 Tax=Clostridium sp. TaxID=1506 RepID=UPI002FCB0714